MQSGARHVLQVANIQLVDASRQEDWIYFQPDFIVTCTFVSSTNYGYLYCLP